MAAAIQSILLCASVRWGSLMVHTKLPWAPAHWMACLTTRKRALWVHLDEVRVVCGAPFEAIFHFHLQAPLAHVAQHGHRA